MLTIKITSMLLEEALRLDTPEKLQKFARRSVKAINSRGSDPINVTKDGAMMLGGSSIVGTVAGGALPYIVSDEADALDAVGGATAGYMLGGIAGGQMLNRRYSPLNNGSTKHIVKRIERDGYQTSAEDRSILNKANYLVRATNLNNLKNAFLRK